MVNGNNQIQHKIKTKNKATTEFLTIINKPWQKRRWNIDGRQYMSSGAIVDDRSHFLIIVYYCRRIVDNLILSTKVKFFLVILQCNKKYKQKTPLFPIFDESSALVDGWTAWNWGSQIVTGYWLKFKTVLLRYKNWRLSCFNLLK